MMTFGGLLGGAGGSGEACLSFLQILQSMVSGPNHALLPLQGCGKFTGYRLCRLPLQHSMIR